MKISQLNREDTLTTKTNGIDLDAKSRIGATINKHIVALQTLIDLVPDNSDVLNQIKTLKDSLSQKINLNSNVLEQQIRVPASIAVQTLTREIDKNPEGNIDKLVTTVSNDSRDKISPESLIQMFSANNAGLTPKEYAGLEKSGAIPKAELTENILSTLKTIIPVKFIKQLTANTINQYYYICNLATNSLNYQDEYKESDVIKHIADKISTTVFNENEIKKSKLKTAIIGFLSSAPDAIINVGRIEVLLPLAMITAYHALINEPLSSTTDLKEFAKTLYEQYYPKYGENTSVIITKHLIKEGYPKNIVDDAVNSTLLNEGLVKNMARAAILAGMLLMPNRAPANIPSNNDHSHYTQQLNDVESAKRYVEKWLDKLKYNERQWVRYGLGDPETWANDNATTSSVDIPTIIRRSYIYTGEDLLIWMRWITSPEHRNIRRGIGLDTPDWVRYWADDQNRSQAINLYPDLRNEINNLPHRLQLRP
jgi:hypothetical protein